MAGSMVVAVVACGVATAAFLVSLATFIRDTLARRPHIRIEASIINTAHWNVQTNRPSAKVREVRFDQVNIEVTNVGSVPVAIDSLIVRTPRSFPQRLTGRRHPWRRVLYPRCNDELVRLPRSLTPQSVVTMLLMDKEKVGAYLQTVDISVENCEFGVEDTGGACMA